MRAVYVLAPYAWTIAPRCFVGRCVAVRLHEWSSTHEQVCTWCRTFEWLRQTTVYKGLCDFKAIVPEMIGAEALHLIAEGGRKDDAVRFELHWPVSVKPSEIYSRLSLAGKKFDAAIGATRWELEHGRTTLRVTFSLASTFLRGA